MSPAQKSKIALCIQCLTEVMQEAIQQSNGQITEEEKHLNFKLEKLRFCIKVIETFYLIRNLRRKSREQIYTKPRRIVWWIANRKLDLPPLMIKRLLFPHFHRSTIGAGVRTVDLELEYNHKFHEELSKLLTKLDIQL